MKISAALHGVFRLAVDSAPFMYLVERPDYADRMTAIFQHIRDGHIIGVSSVITLSEMLAKPVQQRDHVVEIAYRNMLLRSRNFHLKEITVPIAERAVRLCADYHLTIPDALQISTAVDAGCNAFLTNDKALRRVKELPILVLDELELDT